MSSKDEVDPAPRLVMRPLSVLVTEQGHHRKLSHLPSYRSSSLVCHDCPSNSAREEKEPTPSSLSNRSFRNHVHTVSHTHTWQHVHIHTHSHTGSQTHTHTHLHSRTLRHTCTHTYTHKHSDIHTHTFSLTYTQTHS